MGHENHRSVEVRLGDARQVEVDLDRGFKVAGQETNDDGPGDDSSCGP